jgi:hypothetical protein
METSSLGILLRLIPPCWTTDALPPNEMRYLGGSGDFETFDIR